MADAPDSVTPTTGTFRVKRGLAEMLKGGVIMDVVDAAQAKIAEDPGVEAVRHLRSILGDIRKIQVADSAELFDWAKRLQAPLPLVQELAETGQLPVPLFCAGGIATPADASLVLQLGAQAVFVGSGIFKSEDPARRARAIVEATTHFRDASIVAKVSRGLGAAMRGDEIETLDTKLAERGW